MKQMTMVMVFAAWTALADEVAPGPDADSAAVTAAIALAASAGAALLVWLGRARRRAASNAAHDGEEGGR